MKIFKSIGIITLVVFSFYLSDFVTNLAIYSNPLMKVIQENEDDYYARSVNATIENNTIIPGIKGKSINEIESFLNMKDFKSFNEQYLIFDYIIPDISLDNNKDKVIISGNKNLRQVSLLIKKNKDIEEYLTKNKIKYSKLIDDKNNINDGEYINIENNEDNFKDIETILNKKNINKNICLINYSNLKVCKEKKYYLVKANIYINNSNISNSLSKINNGSIIYIDDLLELDNFKFIENNINNKDLEIVYLSKIIQE